MRPYVPKQHPQQRLASPSRGLSSLIHYLTVIGLAIATAAFLFGSLADITASRRLFRLKNWLSVIATPLEVLITTLYGGITAVDKELVVPKEFQIGFWPDVSLHVVPAVVLTLDLLLFSPPWSLSFRQALGISVTFAFAYWFWVEQCYRHNGWYPYPIFEALTIPWRAVLFCFSGGLMAGSTQALKWAYEKLNGAGNDRT
ncbi:MAG: hypothetical protein Q9220_002461 [cf. Caloplaca sp. 1 TL-2023]